MAIIHIQRSIRQVGRIRIGHQVHTSSGKLAPAKLDRFRLSSPQRDPIEHAADLWGGQVVPMDNDRSNDRWQVVTDVDSLRVVIPSTNHFDAWMELWSAAGCDRRCDGERMIVAGGMAADQQCVCDPENRECKPTTRLFVVLPDLEALGTWRLETHGHYAASELGAAVELCSIATRNGYSIPARLELEQRTRRTRDERGKPVTRNFAVPVLSVDVSLPQAKAILGQADIATGEISTPSMRQIEAPAPMAIEAAAPTNGAELMARGVAEMEQRKAELPPPPPADIPVPRTADEYHADNGHDDEPQLFEEPANEPVTLPDPDARPLANKQRARIMALQRTLRMDTDKLRELTDKVSKGRTNSLATNGGIYDTEADELIEILDRMEVEARTKAGT